MDPLSTGLIFLVMIVLMYFLMIRPASKRAKEQQATVNAIQPGTRVVLASGLFGTVRHVGDKQMAIELAPDCTVTVLKGAVVRVAEPDEEEFEYTDAGEEFEPTAQQAVSGGATLAVPADTAVAQDPFYADDAAAPQPYDPAPGASARPTRDPYADDAELIRRPDEER